MIQVQHDDFDLAKEYSALIESNHSDGAVVTFVGLVRDFNQGNRISGLNLEHYPGMTEKALQEIVLNAKKRWELGRVKIIHRIGQLAVNDQIVFVGVTSKHRANAFAATEFIMDFLKTKAPFWKKETSEKHQYWVDAKQSDHKKAQQW